MTGVSHTSTFLPVSVSPNFVEAANVEEPVAIT